MSTCCIKSIYYKTNSPTNSAQKLTPEDNRASFKKESSPDKKLEALECDWREDLKPLLELLDPWREDTGMAEDLLLGYSSSSEESSFKFITTGSWIGICCNK